MKIAISNVRPGDHFQTSLRRAMKHDPASVSYEAASPTTDDRLSAIESAITELANDAQLLGQRPMDLKRVEEMSKRKQELRDVIAAALAAKDGDA